jgi:hypothetical protein
MFATVKLSWIAGMYARKIWCKKNVLVWWKDQDGLSFQAINAGEALEQMYVDNKGRWQMEEWKGKGRCKKNVRREKIGRKIEEEGMMLLQWCMWSSFFLHRCWFELYLESLGLRFLFLLDFDLGAAWSGSVWLCLDVRISLDGPEFVDNSVHLDTDSWELVVQCCLDSCHASVFVFSRLKDASEWIVNFLVDSDAFLLQVRSQNCCMMADSIGSVVHRLDERRFVGSIVDEGFDLRHDDILAARS